MQIAVNVIVGTSVGAIVAASYASGLPLPAIDKEMSGLRTAMLFHDVDRSETPLRGKLDDAVNYLGPDIGPQGGSQAFPKGVVAGVSIKAVLRRLTRLHRTDPFDRLLVDGGLSRNLPVDVARRMGPTRSSPSTSARRR